MSRKNLQHITLKTAESATKNLQDNVKFSSGDHTIKSVYSKTDLEHVNHLNFAAGMPPYLRGISSTMYVTSPWDTHLHTTLTSTDNFNCFLKDRFTAGQREFLLEISTKNEFTPETLDDFKALFKDIPLQDISFYFNTNTCILPLLAFFITTAESQNLKLAFLKGGYNIDAITNLNTLKTTKNSSLEALVFSNTYLPLFNRISISTASLQNQIFNPEIELAILLICGNNQIEKGLDYGLKIDDIATRLSFSFSIGLHYFSEIAKLRAARMLWAKIVKSYEPKNDTSLALHIKSLTNTNTLPNADIYSSVTKSTIKAASAIFGGSQSLETHTNRNSSPELERLDHNIQWYLKEETKITKTVDPWAGSFYVEKQTHDIAIKAWGIFEIYKETGTFSEAIQTELNKLKTDNSQKNSTITKTDCDNTIAKTHLLNITKAVKQNTSNVLELTIEAVKNGASFIEIYKVLN
ncbi:methylmalonyl-CoA mutase family protein [Formosa sp. L2A11]|uniref:methylmalonyl-CoA mutase family protein n=1 Tax=Formosa sp. L2A11 TaxID=2686363 RepID=UPI00131E5888|nr:methylmalonyl-CoA mutase family protein [Formosa sp. L2A11]